MKKIFIIIILLLTIVYLTGRYYYNTGFITNEITIKDNNLPEGFNGLKIVHLTDLLYNKKITNLTNLLEEINNQHADIIIFTGDLIKKTITNEEKTQLIEFLSNIQCNLYKYAVLGDHDTNDVKEILENANFIILEDENQLIYYKDTNPIQIINGQTDNIEEYYTIGLIHKPDEFAVLKNKNINLVFAGHSLGGQIIIPFINGLIKKDGAKIYTNNYYFENDSKLYVSYGIGNEKTNIRFLNKPSINVYRLYTN